MTSLGAWELPEELRMVRETVRRFMENDVKPAEDQVPHDAYELPESLFRPLSDKARTLGLWGYRFPKQYGGGGLNLLGQAVLAEEAAKCRMGINIPACGAFGLDVPSPIFRGSQQQIERYAIPAIQAGKRVYIAISEPSGGSDPARAIRLKAVRRGNSYVLNGQKMWIGAAASAEWGLVFARTDPGAGRGGISCFIVDKNVKGLTMRPIPVIRSLSPYEMFFDNVEVPEENRLGEEGQGFALCDKFVVESRIPFSAGCIGVAKAALRIATEWAKTRETFNSKLADKQAIQWMLADSEMELRAARLLVWQAAWKCDLGQDAKIDSSIAKVAATETASRVVDRAIQIMGGLGVSKELPLERWYRELRVRRISEGPSEVHRMVVARHILRSGND
ncbi:MAG: acyl-CoA dehydrogenase family protein [Betaproteobacteria bacterium]|nr:acyl-CoA dehydrogenase family protein [Betaproteobacteria bacterium]